MLIGRSAVEDYWNVTYIQQEMMELIRGLPPLLSTEVGAPVERLKDFLMTVTGGRLSRLKIVEIEAVSLMARWQERDRLLNAIVRGMLGNTMSAHNNSKYTEWGLPTY